MKKTILFYITLPSFLLIASAVQAELPHVSVYGHALYATPLDGSGSRAFNGGVGGVAGVTLGSSNSRGVVSLGYTHFFGKDERPDFNYVPLKAGLRQDLPSVLSFLYLQGDVGVGFIKTKNADSKSRFAFDFGAGAHFGGLEAAIIWDNFKNVQEVNGGDWNSWLTFQLGFNLGF